MTDARTAAGLVLVNEDNGRLFLLLRSAAHGDWLPPKGHTDPGENVADTALRETREETGIESVSLIDGFARTIEYEVDTPRGRYLKRVTYLLGATDEAELRLSDEHDDGGWFALDEALARIPFAPMRGILREADAYLAKR